MMDLPHAENQLARLFPYITGLVSQELLLQNEYLISENRILRDHFPARMRPFRCLNDPRSLTSENGSVALRSNRWPVW
jgi:hypothetical protein